MKNTKFNVKIAMICENMCEEGFEYKFGSEEGNILKTNHSNHIYDFLSLRYGSASYQDTIFEF